MPDVPNTEQNTDAPEETEEVSTDEQPEDDSQQEQPADEQPKDENEGDDDLPEWAREKMTKANAEAANYRVRAREAEDKLKNAKTLEEVDEIVRSMTQEREQAERALLIENIALKFKLPEKLQKRLVGNTREELEADAKELAEFADADEDEEISLEGGLNPRHRDPDAGLTPRDLANKHGGRKRR